MAKCEMCGVKAGAPRGTGLRGSLQPGEPKTVGKLKEGLCGPCRETLSDSPPAWDKGFYERTDPTARNRAAEIFNDRRH